MCVLLSLNVDLYPTDLQEFANNMLITMMLVCNVSIAINVTSQIHTAFICPAHIHTCLGNLMRKKKKQMHASVAS